MIIGLIGSLDYHVADAAVEPVGSSTGIIRSPVPLPSSGALRTQGGPKKGGLIGNSKCERQNLGRTKKA